MRIIFFGTPDYVVPIADALHKKYHAVREKGVVAVVTQPPKPIGRKKEIAYSPIDNWAYKKKIKILRDLNISSFPSAELGIVASYGKIIPKKIIDNFKFGVLNIHPSLLPKYRGASPIQAAIAAGETTTGVTIIKMDEFMDHGPIVSQFKETINPDDSFGTLRQRLFERSAQFLIDLIPNYLNGKINLKEQNHNEATFTKLITKENGFIKPQFIANLLDNSKNQKNKKDKFEVKFIKDFSAPITAESIHNLIRAFDPWPNAWTYVEISGKIKRLKLIKSRLQNQKLVLEKVQIEGKNPVKWEEFKKGYPNFKFI